MQLLVFHDSPLTAAQQSTVNAIRNRTIFGEGHTNLEVRIIDLQAEMLQKDREAWKSIKSSMGEKEDQQQELVSMPFAVLMGRHVRGPFTAWQGPVDMAAKVLPDSPARREIGERLLAGHSIVWLVIKSSDNARNERVSNTLQEEMSQLSETLELPEGIGLPGSELYSDVPLFLKFSVLEVDRQDPKESFLVGMAETFQPEAFARGEPLILPVFGRARVLEVIPASQFSRALVRDLTQFLSAACSCQVKEQNPGFDLLMDLAWQTQLFGEDGQHPPASTENGLGQQRSPVLLNIPPGRK